MNNSIRTNGIPIIVTAFGTTAKAFTTYKKMDKIFKNYFPDNPIYWAYSSRMVKAVMEKNKTLEVKNPIEVMTELKNDGHKWIVLQSLHLICGHEFDRLITERDAIDIRSAIGLPLLSSPQDYFETANALKSLILQNPTIQNDIQNNKYNNDYADNQINNTPNNQTGDNRVNDQATIVIGHGTDHHSWTAYYALESILKDIYGANIFTGVIEGYPEMDIIVQKIKNAGFKKVRIIPFLLVAGIHFMKDLTKEDNSWQKVFEQNNIEVSVVKHGIGEITMISKIFCRHISDALDIICHGK